MADATITTTRGERKEEDYTGAVCLLVRQLGKKRWLKSEALIDAEKLDAVSHLNWGVWHKNPNDKCFYVACMSPMPGMDGWILPLHRFLTNAPKGMVVDHKNRVRSDNRLQNLRVCTHRQNSLNTGPLKNKISKYKGVSGKPPKKYSRGRRRVGKWKASIGIGGKVFSVGTFQTEEQAAYAYNLLASKHNGEFAYLNDVELTDGEVAFVLSVMEDAIVRKTRWTNRLPVTREPAKPRFRAPINAIDFFSLPEPDSTVISCGFPP